MAWNTFIPVAVLSVAIATLFACDGGRENEETSIKQRAELDQTATVLPPGVRQAWFAALDQAITDHIRFYKGRIVTVDHLSGVSFVPVDLLEARCGGFLSTIELVLPGGGKEGRETIPLLNAMFANVEEASPENATAAKKETANKQDTLDNPLLLSMWGSPAPPLGVGEESPAALRLMNDLCRHLIDRIETMARSG